MGMFKETHPPTNLQSSFRATLATSSEVQTRWYAWRAESGVQAHRLVTMQVTQQLIRMVFLQPANCDLWKLVTYKNCRCTAAVHCLLLLAWQIQMFCSWIAALFAWLMSVGGYALRPKYRVGSRPQANFSAPTFEPAHEARAGQRAALSVQSAAAAMQHLDQRFTSKLSVIFAEQIEIFQVKASLATFKKRNANLRLFDDHWKKKKNNSLIDLRRAFTCAFVERSSMSSASVAAGLFPSLSCLVCSLLTEAFFYPAIHEVCLFFD